MVSRKVPHDDKTSNEQLLIAGAGALGIDVSSHQIHAFSQYLDLLAFWNRRLNLTAIRDPDLVVRRHFVDSLSVVPFLSGDGGILDVGSGAGFPGIPIKLALPGKTVHLLEPRRKRANFLRQVARDLQLAEVHVIERRMEDLSAEPLPPMTGDRHPRILGYSRVPEGQCGPSGLGWHGRSDARTEGDDPVGGAPNEHPRSRTHRGGKPPLQASVRGRAEDRADLPHFRRGRCSSARGARQT